MLSGHYSCAFHRHSIGNSPVLITKCSGALRSQNEELLSYPLITVPALCWAGVEQVQATQSCICPGHDNIDGACTGPRDNEMGSLVL